MSLIRVDLPAPFSPTRAWISPRLNSILTRLRAQKAPKDLPTSRSCSSTLIYDSHLYGKLLGLMLLDIGLVDDFDARIGVRRGHLALGIDFVEHLHGIVSLALRVLS